MQKIKRLAASLIAGLTSAAMLAAPVAAAGTVVVTGDGQADWLFNRDVSTSTPYEFTTEEHSTGAGSLYVKPIANEDELGNPDRLDKFVAEQFINMPVTDLNSLSYDFLIGGGGDADDDRHFYLNVYVNIDDSDNFYDCRFDYVPTTGSTTSFTSVTFDADDTPTAVTKRGTRITACPTTLAGMPEGSYVRVFSINVGDTSATLDDTGLDGYLDNVVVDTVDGVSTYDFEVGPASKADCKNDGWRNFEGMFKNQGDCVSFVASQGRNQPAYANQSQLRF